MCIFQYYCWGIPLSQHIVFLPGTLLSADQFGLQLRSLSSHHTVSVFEYAAHKSGITRANLIKTWSKDVLDYIASIGRPVTLCAHSFGGILAQIVAHKRPELIERLILVETNYCATDSLLDSTTLPLAKMFLKTMPWSNLSKHLINLHGQHSFEASICMETALLHKDEPTLARETMLAALEWDGRDKLEKIFPLTEIVVGEFFDRTQKQAEVFAATIPNARLHRIPNTGHLVNLDAPAEFNRILLSERRLEAVA